MKSSFLLLISLIVMALGIAIVTHANIGTTPITSPAYVLSLAFPLSFGTMMTAINISFLLAQRLILKRTFQRLQWLQLLLMPLLGFFIDTMFQLLERFDPTYYMIKLMMVLLGSLIIAIATKLQLQAKLINNPAEGIVKAYSFIRHRSFSTVKIQFDFSLVVIALIFSLIFLRDISGVREGTVLSAFATGFFIHLFSKNKEASRT
ncbi:YczE/YyaS/YitT family protein [Halolactibacillus miurensis]|uniref:YczE/YyaS/YitT family protein n=1 Tax=Halolactibacillus miurensis TaxID=306541 RepID=UPI0021017DE0|nr:MULTISPECIES: DUF6198 family protein [Halolactibacillus]